MLAKGPTHEAELSRLVNDLCSGTHDAVEAALRAAFELGWRSHAAAVNALDSPPNAPEIVATPTEAEPVAERDVPAGLADIINPPDTQTNLVVEVVKGRRNGQTSMQVIEIVQHRDPDISP